MKPIQPKRIAPACVFIPAFYQLRIWSLLPLLALSAIPAFGMDHVEFSRDGRVHRVDGEAVVNAQDGGLLLLGRDGQLWSLQPDEILSRESTPGVLEKLEFEELKESLSQELSGQFAFHQTAHFLIAYNTSQAYAQWCGSLYERLYRALANFWRRRGIQVAEPRFPLVAIVFASRADYIDYAQAELGESASGIVGYYSLRTNRVAMYDLTGTEELQAPSSRAGSAQLINRLLSRPRAEPSVATLIHEATHQVAYNIGLQTRYADNPLWLSEGLAVYFETPDLSSSKGWRGIGRINARRLAQLQNYVARRPSDSLESLITNDERLRQGATAADAYAEAWGLCHFLIKRRERGFVAYVQELSSLTPLGNTTPDERIETFERHFGNLADLDRRFVNDMTTLRAR